MNAALATWIYPPVTRSEVLRELYLTSWGRVLTPRATPYFAPGHPPEYSFDWESGRVVGDYILLWLESGCGSVEAEGIGNLPIRSGEALFLPPGTWHRYRPDSSEGWGERWVCLNGSYLHRLVAKNLIRSTAGVFPLRHAAEVNSLFDQLQKFAHANSLVAASLALSILALCLELEAPEPGAVASSGEPMVDAVVHYVWSNCHRPIRVDDIARQFKVSRRRLEREFREFWPRGIAAEITCARVQRGLDLLAEKSMTIKEAGYAAGFGGARRFIEAHRRLHGTTPGEVLRRMVI